MFEGLIASKLANKMFEKDIFKTIRMHALFGALIMMIPDFGFGTVFYVIILWHMYSSICKKVGVSFGDNFWSLVGVGIFINIAVAFIIDLVLSVLFFLVGFIIYFQFYLSGKFFVESLKKLDFKGEDKNTVQSVPQITVAQSAPQQTKVIDKSYNQKKVEYITCPICSEQVEKGLRVCPYCNEVISDSSPSIAPVQPQPEQKTTVEEPETIKGEMMRCPICCELIPANSQVCPECNEQIGTSSVENKTEERDYYLYDVDISHLQTKEKVQKYGCSEATTQMVITEKDENKTAIDPSCRSVTIYGSYKSAPNAEYIDIEVKLFTNQEVRQYVGSYYYNDIELKYLDNSTLYLYENMPHKYVEAE